MFSGLSAREKLFVNVNVNVNVKVKGYVQGQQALEEGPPLSYDVQLVP